MPDRILLSPPDVTDAEEQALVRAFRTGWIAPLGPEVDAFEKELAEFCDRRYAVSLSSGTAAIHLALLNFGIGPGDLVVTSTMTFAATTNAIVYTGAEPVFVDSDETGLLSPVLLEQALSRLTKEGTPAAAILSVDLLGHPVDHDRIAAAAADYGIPVVSDTAESQGAIYRGRPTTAFGDTAILSFNGNKIMTTSGGGALLTDDAAVADRVRYLATQARQPVAHYEHTEIGYNYRLSNLLAALGRAQLERLPAMLVRRREIRAAYAKTIEDIPGLTLFGPDDTPGGTRGNCWLTSVLVDADAAGFTADELRAHLGADDIESRPLWKPMHLQPVFTTFRAVVDGTSQRFFTTGVTLPSGSVHGPEVIDRVRSSITQLAKARA